jgi:type II secretory pathway pseudopilin PulG
MHSPHPTTAAPPRAAQCRRNRRALTLMEVLVFIVILSGGLLVCLKALVVARDIASRNAVVGTLTTAAQSELALARARARTGDVAPPAFDTTLTLALSLTSAPTAPRLKVLRHVDVRPISENLYEITVSCKSVSPGVHARSVSLATRVYAPTPATGARP